MGSESLSSWNSIAQIIAFVVYGAAIILLLYYYLRLITLKELKQKYDFINLNEIKYLWNCALLVIIGTAILVNSFSNETGTVWFFVRIFMTLMLGLIVGVIISNVLKFYYPFKVEKKLKKLRYKPRLSPKTGKPMKLLSEEEEDVYLDEGMQAEETVFSVDYDVWIDEETGYTKIEKYSGHLHALKCPECNYQTLKVMKEELLESPSIIKEGELMKYYKCEYCGYKEKRTFKVAKLKESQPEAAAS